LCVSTEAEAKKERRILMPYKIEVLYVHNGKPVFLAKDSNGLILRIRPGCTHHHATESDLAEAEKSPSWEKFTGQKTVFEGNRPLADMEDVMSTFFTGRGDYGADTTTSGQPALVLA
jgi:hypothetical protein